MGRTMPSFRIALEISNSTTKPRHLDPVAIEKKKNSCFLWFQWWEGIFLCIMWLICLNLHSNSPGSKAIHPSANLPLSISKSWIKNHQMRFSFLLLVCLETFLCVCQCIWCELIPCCRLPSSCHLRYSHTSQEKLNSKPKTTAAYAHSNPLAVYWVSISDALATLISPFPLDCVIEKVDQFAE